MHGGFSIGLLRLSKDMEVVQWLRELAAPLVPSTHSDRWLTITCDSSSRDLLASMGAHACVHTLASGHIHNTQIGINL